MGIYDKRKDGEGVRVNMEKESLNFACCDCGLVHRLDFWHIKGKIYDIVFFRENRATGQLRRHKFGELQQLGYLKFKNEENKK